MSSRRSTPATKRPPPDAIYTPIDGTSSLAEGWRQRTIRERELQRDLPAFALAVAWAISLGAFSVVQNIKNFYSATLFLGGGLTLAAILLPALQAKLSRLVAMGIVLTASFAALLTPWVLYLTFLPELRRFRVESGDLPQHVLSIHPLNYDRVAAELERAATACGLAETRELRHLVVDDLSSWYFRESRQPFHAFYLSRSVYGHDIPDLVAFLEARGSSGWLTRCREVTRPELARALTYVDPESALCCWNPNAPARETQVGVSATR